MALWKEQNTSKSDSPAAAREATPNRDADQPSGSMSATPQTAAKDRSRPVESLIAADLKIEGKIEGAGHVRLAGHFTGDIHVEGDLTIDAGAKLTGSVRARTVTVGGELEGNIESATRVDLLASGVMLGDLKAGKLTVAAGSRMRGQSEFGWDEAGAKKSSSAPAQSAVSAIGAATATEGSNAS